MNTLVIPLGLLVFLAVILVIGFVAADEVKGNSANFLVAGRRMPLYLAAATLMAQSVDSNATLGNTDLSSEFGFWAGASLPIGLALCLLLTGLFFAEPLNSLAANKALMTLPDFYRFRYGRLTELIASILMVLSFLFLLAGNLVAGGYLFEAIFNLPYTACVLLIAAIVLVYTVSGGLFAVAYTDVIQIFLALVGSISLFWFIWQNFGFSAPSDMGPFAIAQLADPAAGAVVNWATLLALGLGDIVAIDFMARVFAAKSPSIAKRACLFGSAGTILIGVPFAMIAIAAPRILNEAGVVADGPILISILNNIAPPAIALVVVIGILAASFSTADGAILATSSVIAHNILGINDRAKTANSNDRLLHSTRTLSVFIAIAGVLLAIEVPTTGILLLLAFDISFAGLLIPLVGGLFWSRSTRLGAACCIVIGSLTRLTFFIFMPVMFGVPNTLLYIPNPVFTPDFDGFPTLISPLIGLIFFVAGSFSGKPERVRMSLHFKERG